MALALLRALRSWRAYGLECVQGLPCEASLCCYLSARLLESWEKFYVVEPDPGNDPACGPVCPHIFQVERERYRGEAPIKLLPFADLHDLSDGHLARLLPSLLVYDIDVHSCRFTSAMSIFGW